MARPGRRRAISRLLVAVVAASAVACGLSPSGGSSGGTPAARPTGSPAPTSPPVSRPPLAQEGGEWALWVGPTQLRGANVYQRRVYPELDGPGFMGSGAVGPPYSQDDFDRLAALGANYVNVSHPGLFAEEPPYALDEAVQQNLDDLLAMIARSDMFAVIAFRTGPGRSEFTFMLEEVGDWFDESYLNDLVWRDAEAQDAWVEMWRYTAGRYRDDPVVVGYDLMVEPNANEVLLDLWDADEFADEYGGTLYDWNQLHPRITAAIRQVDDETPILIGGMAYSRVDWLSTLVPNDDERVIYTVHQYAPSRYTHQMPPLLGSSRYTYPGEFDADWDGEDDRFDRAWLVDLFAMVDGFAEQHGVPMAANEFGVVRWAPGAADFLDDEMALFEQRGMNYALWLWETSHELYAEEVDAFNYRRGTDPGSDGNVPSNELMDVITGYWARNQVRPSTLEASARAGGTGTSRRFAW